MDVKNVDSENAIEANLVQYDPNRLAELARRAIGTRSVTEFCSQTNLSKSFVSRIVNGKLNSAPTKRTLYRFAGNNASPQNGVTLGDILVASGYEAREEDFLPSDNLLSEDNSALTFTECIQLYYSSSPAFVLHLLLNVLITKGYGKSYSIDFQPGIFTLTNKELNIPATTIATIPAFCNDNAGITAIQVTVLTNLITSINSHPVDKTLFLIITNNMDLYQVLLKTLPVLRKMKLALLLANEYYTGFSKQDTILPRNSETQLANEETVAFPLLLCD